MGWQEGKWPLWDEEMKCFQMFKEQDPYLPLGYTTQVDFRGLFRQGKVATYLEGNWALKPLMDDPPPFNIGWRAFPKVTAETWPGAEGKTWRLMGPWGNLQPHLPGYLPKTDPEKLPVIKDMLNYLSQPRYVSPICYETFNVPYLEGATGHPYTKPWAEKVERSVSYQSWFMAGPGMAERVRDLLAEYMAGGLSDDAMLEKAKEKWAEVMATNLEANPQWKI